MMNIKAEKFQQFIEQKNIQDSFVVTEGKNADREFVVFDTSVDVGSQYLKLVVILEQGLQSLIRLWFGKELLNKKNQDQVLHTLNGLNAQYKIFKFYADKDGTIIMDWANAASDENFDANLIHFTLGVINREISSIHKKIMKSVWS